MYSVFDSAQRNFKTEKRRRKEITGKNNDNTDNDPTDISIMATMHKLHLFSALGSVKESEETCQRRNPHKQIHIRFARMFTEVTQLCRLDREINKV